MRGYSEAAKADVRRWMGPPQRQSLSQISAELGNHVVTLSNLRKSWRFQREVVLEERAYRWSVRPQPSGTAGCRDIWRSITAAGVIMALEGSPPIHQIWPLQAIE